MDLPTQAVLRHLAEHFARPGAAVLNAPVIISGIPAAVVTAAIGQLITDQYIVVGQADADLVPPVTGISARGRDLAEVLRYGDLDNPESLLELIKRAERRGDVEETTHWRQLLGAVRRDRTRPRVVVPAITTDAVDGVPDQLGIEGDARALAALVASKRLEPPLAIGLYGEWGSGKTFFMRRLQANVEQLATVSSDDETAFHTGIAHVWFSAWHYAEGNLWASLLHHVFASLRPSKSKLAAALDDAIERVGGAQRVTAEAAAEVTAARVRVESAETAVESAQARYHDAINDAGKLRARDLWSAIQVADDELVETVKSKAKEVGVPVAANTAKDLWDAAQHITQLTSRVRVLATMGRWYRTPLAFACYAALLVGGAGLALGIVLHHQDAWFGTVATVLAQFVAVGSAVAAWLVRQARLVRSFLAPAESLQRSLEKRVAEAQRRQNEELIGLQEDARLAVVALAAAESEQLTARLELEKAEANRNDLKGSRLLERYLAERTSSGDYDRYMGVVALVHRDLKDLDEHLREAAAGRAEGETGLDRIVLYIDDLDRCDPRTVADVLDAVHLLLALRLFVVVVGVDPRWLERSLREQHPALLGGGPTGSTARGALAAAGGTSPADYLEKIFNLTYTLAPMDAQHSAGLIAAAAAETQPGIRGTVDANGKEVLGLGESARSNEAIVLSQSSNADRSSVGALSEALILREVEIEALRAVAPLVATSPRRVKRFLSVYLTVRARILGDSVLRQRLVDSHGVADVAKGHVLLLAIAACVGLPLTMAQLAADPDADRAAPLAAQLFQAAVGDEASLLRSFLDWTDSTAEVTTLGEALDWLPIVRPYLPLGWSPAPASSSSVPTIR